MLHRLHNTCHSRPQCWTVPPAIGATLCRLKHPLLVRGGAASTPRGHLTFRLAAITCSQGCLQRMIDLFHVAKHFLL